MMPESKVQYDYYSPLTRSYLPPRLLFREKELNELESFYVTSFKLKSFPVLLLSGPKSSGKTALALKLIERLKSKLGLKGIMIDCDIEYSEYKVVSKVINLLGIAYNKIKGSSTEELFSFLVNYLIRDRVATLLVFDNIELLANSKKRFLLTALLKLNENFKEASGNIALLFIADDKELENLRHSVKEFQRVPVLRLRGYTKEQIYHIIRHRLSLLVFSPECTMSSIKRLAELSANCNDINLAFSLLSSLISRTKGTGRVKITKSMVDDAYSNTLHSYPLEYSFNLSDEEKFIFNMILSFKNNRLVHQIKSSSIWKAYREDCERKGRRSMSYTKFWNILIQLERKGLIKRNVKSFGRFGRSTLIFLSQ